MAPPAGERAAAGPFLSPPTPAPWPGLPAVSSASPDTLPPCLRSPGGVGGQQGEGPGAGALGASGTPKSTRSHELWSERSSRLAPAAAAHCRFIKRSWHCGDEPRETGDLPGMAQ